MIMKTMVQYGDEIAHIIIAKRLAGVEIPFANGRSTGFSLLCKITNNHENFKDGFLETPSFLGALAVSFPLLSFT